MKTLKKLSVIERAVRRRYRRSPSAQIRALAEHYYAQADGMQLYSTEESDVYWEFAEAVMCVLAESRGVRLNRKEPE